MTTRLTHQRIPFDVAANFVSIHHRHHTPPVGHFWSIGACRNDELVGVIIVGRPVSRQRDDGLTAEVTRLCVRPDEPNACSFLYGKAAKAALALGFRRIGTYTPARGSGTALRAAGWTLIAQTPGHSWSRPYRPRTDKHTLEPRNLWEVAK